MPQKFRICRIVVFQSQSEKNLIKSTILFLHFLMMAPTLLCLSSTNKVRHGLEYLISSPQVPKNEMSTVNFEKPMVQLVLLLRPMTFVDASCLFFWIFNFDILIFLLSLLLYLLAAESQLTFFPKQRLKVITWDGFFLVGGEKYLGIMTNVLCVVLANLTF